MPEVDSSLGRLQAFELEGRKCVCVGLASLVLLLEGFLYVYWLLLADPLPVQFSCLSDFLLCDHPALAHEILKFAAQREVSLAILEVGAIKFYPFVHGLRLFENLPLLLFAGLQLLAEGELRHGGGRLTGLLLDAIEAGPVLQPVLLDLPVKAQPACTLYRAIHAINRLIMPLEVMHARLGALQLQLDDHLLELEDLSQRLAQLQNSH